MAEPFDADDVRAATALDEEIDRALHGAPSAAGDPTVTWLATALRVGPPATLYPRLADERARAERRRLRPVRIAVAVLAYLFLSHGIGNLVNSEWISRNLDEAHSPHAYTEGGFALIVVGAVLAVSLFRRAWLSPAVAAGVPLGLAFGLLGIDEVGEFGAGAALHLSQAGFAIVLGIAWWRFRRYGSPPSDEEGT